MSSSRSEPVARIRGIEGLRAIAAISVLAYHVAFATGYAGTGSGFAGFTLLAPLLSELKAGVTVFFVISGTVLYLPFARAIERSRPLPDWREFARRRAARIIPAYWAALVVSSLLLGSSTTFGGGAWRYFVFTQAYDPNTFFGGLGVAWSLDLEVAFYVSVPLLAYGLQRVVAHSRRAPHRVQLSMLVWLAGGSLLLRLALSGFAPLAAPAAVRTVAGTSLPAVFDWFAVGMALAVLRARIEAGGALPRGLRLMADRPGLAWVAALTCFAVAVPLQRGNLFVTMYSPVVHVALGAGAALLVLPAILPMQSLRAPASRPCRLLEAAPLAGLGAISYGIYLWHQPMLFLLHGSQLPVAANAPVPAALGLLALVLVLALGAACVSWRLIERPAQRAAARAAAIVTSGPLPEALG